MLLVLPRWLLSPEKLRARGDARARDLLTYLEGGHRRWPMPNTAGFIPQPGIQPLLQTLEEVANRNQKTIAKVSLNWIICKGAIPIPGIVKLTNTKK